jgi:tyrocidine synthetase-3
MTFDAYQASSAQKRIYLVNRLSGDSIVYNMPQAWIIEGELDEARLEIALRQLVQRHEILKTSFAFHEGKVIQEIHGEIEVKLTISISTGGSVEELLNGWVRPFNLETVPLWRAGCVNTGPNCHVFLLDIHLIIADGISLNVFIDRKSVV